MKKILIFALILLCLGVIPLAKTSKTSNTANAMCKIDDNRSGCCSKHGGVCGCNKKSHKQKCCDGTLSNSCGC